MTKYATQTVKIRRDLSEGYWGASVLLLLPHPDWVGHISDPPMMSKYGCLYVSRFQHHKFNHSNNSVFYLVSIDAPFGRLLKVTACFHSAMNSRISKDQGTSSSSWFDPFKNKSYPCEQMESKISNLKRLLKEINYSDLCNMTKCETPVVWQRRPLKLCNKCDKQHKLTVTHFST